LEKFFGAEEAKWKLMKRKALLWLKGFKNNEAEQLGKELKVL